MEKLKINVKKLGDTARLPEYKTDGAACFDFYLPEDYQVRPASFGNKIGLGLAFEIPKGYALLVYPRSSIGLNTKLRQSNNVGIIDSDYRGEISVILDNVGLNWHELEAGLRIAQGMIIPVPSVEFEEVEQLSDTERGINGFGSTGR